MPTGPRLSRRGFLAAAGGVSLATTLGVAGCSSDSGSSNNGGSGEKKKDTLKLILPGAVPTSWQGVADKLNTRMQADLGFTMTPQFVNWSQYQTQSLLKYTAGESFDMSLQARWLNMAQLVGSSSLTEVGDAIASGKYPNLQKTLAPKLLELNKWNGKLWGVPQVNSAARIQHFCVREDLAKQVGLDEIGDYATLEKYFYDIKQRNSSIIPFGVSSNLGFQMVVPVPAGLFNAHSWDNPDGVAQAFNGSSVYFVFAKDAATTGSSSPVPFYEAEGVVDALRTVRKYYQDGIINRDGLNSDSAAISGLFNSGKVASVWAITDGGASNSLPALQKAVPGATLANVMPLKGGLTAKPAQTFQADNFAVLNVKGGSSEQALQLEDYFSIKENHDLLAYGIEGTDWEPVGDDKFKPITGYNFPGYSVCWRKDLELKSQYINTTENAIFEWAKNYDNFTVDTFASFVPDVTPIKKQDAQIAAAMTQFGNPLFCGAVDVDQGLDKLKKALAAAGLDKVQAEMQTQADAHLASHS